MCRATAWPAAARRPSDKLQIAGIGVGGQGGGDMDGLAGGNTIVALCDVDEKRSADTFKKHPDAKKYKDFRKMFDEMEKKIDAVLVATPDHFHAVAAMAAHQARQARLLREAAGALVHEVRELMKAAKEAQRRHAVGQPGPFVRDDPRCSASGSGTAPSARCTPSTPAATAVNSARRQACRSSRSRTRCRRRWTGTCGSGPAQQRPYHPAYLPGAWRGWVPFGNGTIGDWICHVVDPVFWALDLGAPDDHPGAR